MAKRKLTIDDIHVASEVMVQLYDMKYWVQDKKRIPSGNPAYAIVVEIDKRKKYPYLVSYMHPAGCMSSDYEMEESDIIEVLSAGFVD